MINDDHHALSDLQCRLAVVRDRVRGVAVRLHTGFYIFGRPGTSKTYTVKRTLDNPMISPAEGMEITEFLIYESQKREYRLDLRLLVDKAFRDYLQHQDGQTETHWKDLVRATLDEQLVSLEYTQAPKTRQSTKEAEYELIRSIMSEHVDLRDRVDAWMSLTNKSERAFYRRLKEIDY